MNLEDHCGKSNCYCTHTHGCSKGWIEMEYVDEKKVVRNGIPSITLTTYQGVRPCQTCDPERYEIWWSSISSFEYHERLRMRSTVNRTKAYENEERDKTRTL
jgi:hypothetical protein